VLVFLVIVSSFLIRVWQLDSNPAGFFCDEAVGAYEAWSIVHLGHDSHGEKFPLFFKGLNYDNLSPFNTYLPLPFITIFGLNEFAVRLTAVVFSVFQLFIFYLTLKQIIPKKWALLGMIMLSISPWHFHLSRIHINDYYAWILLVNLSLLFLLKAFKTDKNNYYILSGLSLGLASYSYFPSRLISPILFLVLFFIIFLQKKFTLALLTLLVFALVLIPFAWTHINDTNSFTRLHETVKLDSSGSFFEKYFLHFSDDFLFQKGDTDFPTQFIRRHSITGVGLLYPYQKLLIILGLIWTLLQIYHKKNYSLIFVLSILLLSPIPDSLTSNPNPYATRSYLEILPLYLLSSFGLFVCYKIVDKLTSRYKLFLKFLFSCSVVFIIILSTFTLLDKFTKNPLTTSDYWGWQYGPRDIMKYFLTNKDNYDDLYISSEFNGTEIFPKFYDPENHCQDKCKIGDFYRQPQIINPHRKQIFSLSPEYLNKSAFKDNFFIKKTIYYPNYSVAFYIGEIVE